MKRSDQVKMTYCKLVRLLDDSDTSYVSIRRDAAQEMARLADFATDVLHELEKGSSSYRYAFTDLVEQHWPEPKAQPQDEVEEAIDQLRTKPPAFGEVPL